MRILKIGAIVLAVLFEGICVQQYVVTAQEKDELKSRITRVERQLIKAKKTVVNLKKLEEDRKQVETQLSRLSLFLPPDLGERDFMDRCTSAAKEYNLQVYDHEIQVKKHGFYQEAVFRVGLTGREEDIHALIEKMREGKRLILWKKLPVIGDNIPIRLSIFSFRPFKHEGKAPEDDPCKGFASRVRVWPFTKGIQDYHRALTESCAENRSYGKILSLIEDLEQKKRHVRLGSEVVKTLLESE